MNSVFKLLFRESDYICVGNDVFANKVFNVETAPIAEFFSINPLSPKMDYSMDPTGLIKAKYGRGRRADLNVVRFQNFLFEMDNMPLDEQLKIWNSLDIPIASLVYSGGKSYHAIISLEEPLDVKPHTIEAVQVYKAVWSQIAEHLAKLAGKDVNIFDTACKNPSRLSRYPGAMREGSVQQTLIRCGVLAPRGSLPVEVDIGRTVAAPVSEVAAENQEQLKVMMPVELYNRLKFPKFWAAPAGMYPELLRLTLWAIDATAAPKDLLLGFMEKHTFPGLVKAGYPAHKLRKPIDDAYKMKGMT